MESHPDHLPPPPPPPGSDSQSTSYPPPPGPPPGYPGPPPNAPPGYFPGMPFYPPPVSEKLCEKEKLPRNSTIYIKNMNSKIKTEYLKMSLQNVFSQFGKILQISIKKNFRMRGQAFIIYEDEDMAEKALKAMDGALFYQKPLMINYARKKSDVIAKKTEEISEEERKRREDNNRKFKQWIEYVRNLRAQEKLNKLKHEQNELMNQSHKRGRDNNTYGDDDQPGFPGQEGGGSLKIRNLPGFINQMSLHGIFQSYPGFSELRLAQGSDNATILFNSQEEAAAAFMGLQDYRFQDGHKMDISLNH
ncbi:unnamed protein product [Moneuplotes crassus]|uniref:RRM domain-containing protein n=1 Tax=Euplotes crassus TaxID=5936 RepID=A0AAD2D0F4_EUPCR|nr:unnamed protein product [Moneuplotes crassus]